MAGGGVNRGYIFGSSDGLAAEPASDPLSVENYAHNPGGFQWPTFRPN